MKREEVLAERYEKRKQLEERKRIRQERTGFSMQDRVNFCLIASSPITRPHKK